MYGYIHMSEGNHIKYMSTSQLKYQVREPKNRKIDDIHYVARLANAEFLMSSYLTRKFYL